MVGHALEAGGTVDFERLLAAENPGSEDEVRVAGGVVGVEMGVEYYPDLRWVKGFYPFVA